MLSVGNTVDLWIRLIIARIIVQDPDGLQRRNPERQLPASPASQRQNRLQEVNLSLQGVN